jgi:hypothetical protein
VKQTGTITGKKAGKATVVARVAGKSYKCAVTVLSNKQIENRVYSRVHKYYGNLTRLGCYRRGTTLEVEIGRPRGEGAIVITYKVNLKTGKAVADYYTWREFFRKAPRTFTVF